MAKIPYSSLTWSPAKNGKYFESGSFPELSWLTNNEELLIKTSIEDDQGLDKTNLFLASLSGEVRKIDIGKVLNTDDFMVLSISLRPTVPQ